MCDSSTLQAGASGRRLKQRTRPPAEHQIHQPFGHTQQPDCTPGDPRRLGAGSWPAVSVDYGGEKCSPESDAKVVWFTAPITWKYGCEKRMDVLGKQWSSDGPSIETDEAVSLLQSIIFNLFFTSLAFEYSWYFRHIWVFLYAKPLLFWIPPLTPFTWTHYSARSLCLTHDLASGPPLQWRDKREEGVKFHPSSSGNHFQSELWSAAASIVTIQGN